MPAFTVRVQLNGNPTWDDYEKLHEDMENAGYNRFIRGSNNEPYDLPDAEYDLPQSGLTVGEVRDQVLEIAKGVHPKPAPWVLVTQSAGRAWSTKKL